MPHYERSNQLMVERFLRENEGSSVAYLLSNGHLANLQSTQLESNLVMGADQMGVQWRLPVGQITAWALMPAPEPEAEPAAPAAPSEGDEAVAQQMRDWQVAFMALRAACDVSVDPAVVDAVAVLEAIEERADG